MHTLVNKNNISELYAYCADCLRRFGISSEYMFNIYENEKIDYS